MSGIPLFLWVDEKKVTLIFQLCVLWYFLAGRRYEQSEQGQDCFGSAVCVLLLLSACQVGRRYQVSACARVLIVSSWCLFLPEMRSSVLQWNPGQYISVSWEDFGVHAVLPAASLSLCFPWIPWDSSRVRMSPYLKRSQCCWAKALVFLPLPGVCTHEPSSFPSSLS